MKYIKIKECSECRYSDEIFNIKRCINPDLPDEEFPEIIEDLNKIPEWCPLPELPTNINQEIRDEVKNIIS